MALVPEVGAKCSDSIWANTIVEPPQAMERGQSWPQTTATGEQQELDEAPASPTKPKSGSPDHSVGPQTPELQCVPYVPQNTKPNVPQNTKPPDTALARYSLDSALAASADSAKADQPKPKPPPQQIALSTSGFFLRQAKELVKVPVFGEDYVTDQVTEVFYIGEKPPRPLRDDGVIRMPDLDHPGKFQDGFKVDITGNWFHERFLRDLHADKNIVCCQRRKINALNPTIMMCSGASWDTKQLVATVRKAGDKKAFIHLEKKGQTEYVVEGDLVQRNYTVKLSNAQVAQVMHDDPDARAAVTTRHCYSVQVEPGTDCVLMIAAAMAIEDLYTK